MAPPLDNLEKLDTWVAQDWVYENGSDEAQVHLRGKLDEESTELAAALVSGNRNEIIDELGDFLWTATAIGLNVGITSTNALRHELRPDQIRSEVITFDQVDELALRLIAGVPVDQVEEWVKCLSHHLRKSTTQCHFLSTLIDPEVMPQNLSEALINIERLRAYDLLTQSVLITSALAQRYACATISDIVAKNVEKLLNRRSLDLPIMSQVKMRL